MITDNDLARIRVACLESVNEYGNKDAKDILALLARLDAADAMAAAIKARYGQYDHDLWVRGVNQSLAKYEVLCGRLK